MQVIAVISILLDTNYKVLWVIKGVKIGTSSIMLRLALFIMGQSPF